MLVLRLGNALTVGFEQMLIQRDAVGRDASEVLDTFAYYYGVVNNNFSYGAAAGLFKGVLSLMLILARQQTRARLRRGRTVSEMTATTHRCSPASTSRPGVGGAAEPAGQAGKGVTLSRRAGGDPGAAVLRSCSPASPPRRPINEAGGLVLVPTALTVEAYRQIFTNQLVTALAAGQPRHHRRRHGALDGGDGPVRLRAVAARVVRAPRRSCCS